MSGTLNLAVTAEGDIKLTWLPSANEDLCVYIAVSNIRNTGNDCLERI